MTRAIRNMCSAAAFAALALVEVAARQLPILGRGLQFEDSMWGGGELEETSLMRLQVHHKLDYDVEYTGPAERNVHVLGLQNTGTNLLSGMLMKNYPNRLAFYDYSFHNGTYLKHGIWKHSNIKDLHGYNKSAFAPIVENNVTALIMVRDPMSWLQSMKKAPYELVDCVSGSDWLSRSCLHVAPDGYTQARHPRTLASLEAVWNVWMYAYETLTNHGFKHGLIIRYEDLVETPRRTMDAIMNHLGMRKPAGGWDILERSAKDHGHSHGRTAALQRITTKSFLKEFTGPEVAQACARLDKELLARHGYASCQAATAVLPSGSQGPAAPQPVHTQVNKAATAVLPSGSQGPAAPQPVHTQVNKAATAASPSGSQGPAAPQPVHTQVNKAATAALRSGSQGPAAPQPVHTQVNKAATPALRSGSPRPAAPQPVHSQVNKAEIGALSSAQAAPVAALLQNQAQTQSGKPKQPSLEEVTQHLLNICSTTTYLEPGRPVRKFTDVLQTAKMEALLWLNKNPHAEQSAILTTTRTLSKLMLRLQIGNPYRAWKHARSCDTATFPRTKRMLEEDLPQSNFLTRHLHRARGEALSDTRDRLSAALVEARQRVLKECATEARVELSLSTPPSTNAIRKSRAEALRWVFTNPSATEDLVVKIADALAGFRAAMQNGKTDIAKEVLEQAPDGVFTLTKGILSAKA